MPYPLKWLFAAFLAIFFGFSMSTPNTSRGVLFTVLAFMIWGLFPLYWKALHGIDALQIISHRIVWSAVFVAVILLLQKNWGWLIPAVKNPRVLGVLPCLLCCCR